MGKIIWFFLILAAASVPIQGHEIEGEYCFVTKGGSVYREYCLNIGETSIEVHNGPVRFTVESLKIICANQRCNIDNAKGRRYATVKLLKAGEYYVELSNHLPMQEVSSVPHKITKFFDKGEVFRKVE